jgi:hypothetical protein
MSGNSSPDPRPFPTNDRKENMNFPIVISRNSSPTTLLIARFASALVHPSADANL